MRAAGRARVLAAFTGATVASACGPDDSRAFTAEDAARVRPETPVDLRATQTNGFDITLNSIIIRRDGDRVDSDDDELRLAFKNRAVFEVTVINRSDGWAPIEFEVCIDHPDSLAVIDPANDYLESNPPLEDPCVVRYGNRKWPVSRQGTDEVFIAGAVIAKDAGGGYITIIFRVEFEKAGSLDILEYTVPYRVLPH